MSIFPVVRLPVSTHVNESTVKDTLSSSVSIYPYGPEMPSSFHKPGNQTWTFLFSSFNFSLLSIEFPFWAPSPVFRTVIHLEIKSTVTDVVTVYDIESHSERRIGWVQTRYRVPVILVTLSTSVTYYIHNRGHSTRSIDDVDLPVRRKPSLVTTRSHTVVKSLSNQYSNRNVANKVCERGLFFLRH